MEHYFSDYDSQNISFCLQKKQNDAHRFITPMDEDSIIFFQNLLLIPHVHFIKIHDLEYDRSIFLRLLTSVYHQTCVQYIAQKILILPEYENLYTHFLCVRCDDVQYSFEQYWLEYGKAQVVWIELTPDISTEYHKMCMDIITVLETKEIPVFVLHE